MEIRTSRQSDPAERSKIRDLHKQAFGADKGGEIAQLVDDLFSDGTAEPILSLVAAEDEELLGHTGCYPKCGFIPSGKHGLDAPYPIPEEHSDAWMVQDLTGKLLGKVSGTVRCSRALNEPQHWRE